MYKLFINNIQIGNYKTIKAMLVSALNCDVIRNGVKAIRWDKKSVFVSTY